MSTDERKSFFLYFTASSLGACQTKFSTRSSPNCCEVAMFLRLLPLRLFELSSWYPARARGEIQLR